MSSSIPISSNSTNNFLNPVQSKKIPPSKAPVGLARGPNLKNVRSKIGSLNNVQHRPAGGEKKIESQKLNWNTKPRVGSLENAQHKPHGGKVRINTQKLEWNARPKVGSLNNVKHVPGGGNVKIFDEKYASGTASQASKSGNMTPNGTTITADSQYDTDQLLKETQEKLQIHDSLI